VAKRFGDFPAFNVADEPRRHASSMVAALVGKVAEG
jgi:hypothetical protein